MGKMAVRECDDERAGGVLQENAVCIKNSMAGGPCCFFMIDYIRGARYRSS